MTEQLRALALAATRPANSQEWAGMDASTAFLLINRHADGWADIDLMMTEWRLANPPENTALLGEIDRLKAEIADHERAYELLFKECGELRKDAEWRPIETAPEDMAEEVVVRWLDSDGAVCQQFDYTEDGCWMEWHNHAEHVEIIGEHGVSYTPPYTHWKPLPAPPDSAAKGESHE
jgi:hypothetical protein